MVLCLCVCVSLETMTFISTLVSLQKKQQALLMHLITNNNHLYSLWFGACGEWVDKQEFGRKIFHLSKQENKLLYGVNVY